MARGLSAYVGVGAVLVAFASTSSRAQSTFAPGHSREAFLLTSEAAGALLLGQPQRALFGPGVTGALSAYRTLSPAFSLGLRLRGAAFLNRDASDVTRADPGAGGLGTMSIAARLRPWLAPPHWSRATGPWVELAGGGGVTGHLLRPAAEVGLGWGFPAGTLVVGPTLRYVHVFQSGAGWNGADAKAVLVGIELTLFDPPPPPPPRPLPPATPQVPADSDGDGLPDPADRCPKEPEDKDDFEDDDGCPDDDNDRDGISDASDRCPDKPEVVNGVDDNDGCPDEGVIVLVDDRVVLEERLLFDTDRARVSSRGKRVLQAVVHMWRQHPEWDRMEVEGHTDVRGPGRYNQWLSEERAKRVLAMLRELGLPADKLTFRGFGFSRPRAKGSDPETLQMNRRVELVVIRKRPADENAGTQSVTPPPAPSSDIAPSGPHPAPASSP